MRKLWRVVGSFGLAAALAGCGREQAPVATTQGYMGKGVVKELEPDGRTLVIQHEAISNYMAAMTMPFEVRDTNLLRGIEAGDEINFHLVVTAQAGWIDSITRLRRNAAVSASPPGVHFLPAAPELDEGDLLPEYHFTNELGEAVSMGQFKGGVVALTFFFTSCPFPDFCPRMTGNFAEAEQQLKTMTNAPAAWRLLSISFDPTNDTPARLKGYAEERHYDARHWSFLSGETGQIEGLADQLGEQFWREGAGLSHNLRTVVVDPGGRIRKIFSGNKWTVAQLVTEMVEAGHGPKQ
jgi:protein SCO1